MNRSRILASPAIITAFFHIAGLVIAPLYGQEAVKCDVIFSQVQASAAKDRLQVLTIVEKEVRAHETCACEIIKAAILTSQATPDLINQIREVAITAAPAQEKIINDCIDSLKVASGKEVVKVSGKDIIIDPPLEGQGDTTSRNDRDDYFVIPPDIRGVYLIQPAAAGVFLRVDPQDPGDKEDDDRRRNNPPRRPVPQSPSNATP